MGHPAGFLVTEGMAAGFERVRVGPDFCDKVPMRRGCHQPVSWMKILQQRWWETCLTPLPPPPPSEGVTSIPGPCSGPPQKAFASLSAAPSLGGVSFLHLSQAP